MAGRDRARGRTVVQALPDPLDDDGRLISRLVLKQIADPIDAEYSADQVVIFLEESGIVLDQVPALRGQEPVGAITVLAALAQGSANRRILRSFIGRWLDNSLHTGPTCTTRIAATAK